MRTTVPDLGAHKRIVLETYARTEQPILIGPVTMLRGWHLSLTQTEELLEDLVSEGRLRRATDAEKHQFDIRVGYFPV